MSKINPLVFALGIPFVVIAVLLVVVFVAGFVLVTVFEALR